MMLKHTPTKLPGGQLHLLVLRGFLGFSAMILFFYTITTIPLGIAITLNKTSPLFVSVLAFFLLQEHLDRKGVIALLIGFIGVLLITKPTGLTFSYEHFLGILVGFFAAAAYTTIKKIKHIYDARVIVLSFMTTGAVVPLLLFLVAPYIDAPAAVSFLFVDFHLPESTITWSLILLMGLISTLSQWLLTKAYSLSRAGIIGVVSYTNIPFAIGFGYMLGDLFPDFWTFCGIGLIVLGGLLVKRG
jgi:drug/metabolite transporter (DMT)-like permease